MADRRALIEGLKQFDKNIDTDLAEEFINGPEPERTAKKPSPKNSPPKPEEPVTSPPLPQSIIAAAETSAPSHLTGVGRVPMGARVRTELAAAFKRASLERQLQGVQPSSVQDMLEDSIQLWLLKHGYLK